MRFVKCFCFVRFPGCDLRPTRQFEVSFSLHDINVIYSCFGSCVIVECIFVVLDVLYILCFSLYVFVGFMCVVLTCVMGTTSVRYIGLKASMSSWLTEGRKVESIDCLIYWAKTSNADPVE